MKNIIVVFLLYVIITGCSINKEPLSNCQHPNFKEWRMDCLKRFERQFNLEERVKHGMIMEYVRREIVNINIEKQEATFCKLKYEQKKDWDKFILIYHYLEGEVSYAVESFIFQNDNNCKGFAWDITLDKIRKNRDCFIYKQSDTYESDYINNGLLIISSFNKDFKLEKTDMYFGVANKQFDLLVSTYPKN